jgi:hypothetical protein
LSEKDLEDNIVKSAEEVAKNIRSYLERSATKPFKMLLHEEVEKVAEQAEKLANTFKAYSYKVAKEK